MSESERIQQQILNTLAKHKAVQHLLKGQIKNVSPKKASPEKAVSSKLDGDDDMFKLPPIVSQGKYNAYSHIYILYLLYLNCRISGRYCIGI